MSELVVILNALILLGRSCLRAHFAVRCEKLLSSVIALGVTGIFAAAEFLLLHAPDVAISEAAVGAALTPYLHRDDQEAQGRGRQMKKFLTIVCLAAFLIAGVFAAVEMAQLPPTYDGANAKVSPYELMQDPEAYDDSEADGAAAAIVQQNLVKTHAVNDVTSIVFDFRGYDTMGESFIMILTVSSVIILLRKTKAEKRKMKEERDGKIRR